MNSHDAKSAWRMAGCRENMPDFAPARQKASCPSTSIEARREAVFPYVAGGPSKKVFIFSDDVERRLAARERRPEEG
jgi:hypothetical protein